MYNFFNNVYIMNEKENSERNILFSLFFALKNYNYNYYN